MATKANKSREKKKKQEKTQQEKSRLNKQTEQKSVLRKFFTTLRKFDHKTNAGKRARQR